MLGKLQKTVMEILAGAPHQPLSRYAEWMITVVVLVNCSAVILDSVPEIHADHKEFFHELEFWSVMFFTVEYVLRVWSLGARFTPEEGGAWKGRKGYIFSAFGLVDFFATAPHYVHIFFPGLDLRILRVLRLLAYFETLQIQHGVARLVSSRVCRATRLRLGRFFVADFHGGLGLADALCRRA